VEEVLADEGVYGVVSDWVSDKFSVNLAGELRRLVTKILGPIPGFFSFINNLKKDTHKHCLGLTPTVFDSIIHAVTYNPMFKV
jgi:hypothetical protein